MKARFLSGLAALLLLPFCLAAAPRHFDLSSPDGLISSFEVYRRTLHRVADLCSDCTVFPSHNEPIRPGAVLVQAAQAFDHIASGALPDEVDETGLKKYNFHGFSVVTH